MCRIKIRKYVEIVSLICESDDYIFTFVKEAESRNIIDDEYLLKWDKYCDEVFKNIKQD